MSRKLSALKKELAQLKRATERDGSDDNFLELTLAVAGLLPERTDRDEDKQDCQQH